MWHHTYLYIYVFFKRHLRNKALCNSETLQKAFSHTNRRLHAQESDLFVPLMFSPSQYVFHLCIFPFFPALPNICIYIHNLLYKSFMINKKNYAQSRKCVVPFHFSLLNTSPHNLQTHSQQTKTKRETVAMRQFLMHPVQSFTWLKLKL